MFNEQITRRKQEVEQQIQSIHQKLNQFPNGSLTCYQNGSYTKWYLEDMSQHREYIQKEDRKLAEKYAVKKYYAAQLEDLQREYKAINQYLKVFNPEVEKAPGLLEKNSPYQELLNPYFKKQSDQIEVWLNEPYEHCPNYPEKLIHKTVAGHMVRSKSEEMITYILYSNKIPYRYECALDMGTYIMYPDFTILHPKKLEIIYYEHFGMMNDPKYSDKAYRKMREYTENGIIPGNNLFMTFETEKNPLNFDIINQLVLQNFM